MSRRQLWAAALLAGAAAPSAALGAYQQTFYFKTDDNPNQAYSSALQASGTSVATANNAEYALFSGVTGSSVQILNTRDTNNVGLHGIEIVSGTKSIGFQFSLGQNNTQDFKLLPTDTAGVVPMMNWNTLKAPTQQPKSGLDYGDTSNIESPTAGTIVDSTGAAVPGMSLTFSATNTWSVYGATQTGDKQLLNGYLDNTNAATPTTVTITGVPYASYDVYTYLGSDGNGRTGHITVASPPLPEPATFGVLGLAGIGLLTRRRQT